MEEIYRYFSHQDTISLEYLHWFYAKSKVPICLAITDDYPFLDRLAEAEILSQEEYLKLKADTRSVHRIIYESLCWIEEKAFPLEYVFDNLFQKSFLNVYPNLKPICKEYRQDDYKTDMPITTDKEKDLMIFAQEKVKICLAITELFPFIHGLADLTILSEIEALRLLADGRPVSRVIYECLSLIEKKDLRLSVVFEYIYQQCYQTLYPDLQAILQESALEHRGPFNGKQHFEFNKPGGLLEFYEQNKSDITAAINDRFPLLNGLHDVGLLSKLELLKLQADQRTTSDVLQEALGFIQKKSEIEAFFTYLFREFYLSRFPDLRNILFRLNQTLRLDKHLAIPDMVDVGSQDVRTCRLKPTCYTELPDNDWDRSENCKTALNSSSTGKGVKSSLQMKLQKRRHKETTKLHIPKDGRWDVTTQQDMIRDAFSVAVRLEFPKQLFSDKFKVSCGHKTGIFMKEHWTGEPRIDMCIKCDKSMFTVNKFEKYGGREAAKNWKKTIFCAGITIEKLFQAGILKCPNNIKKSMI